MTRQCLAGPRWLSSPTRPGQTDPTVSYLARGAGATLFFAPDEVVLALPDPGAALESPTEPGLAGAVVRLRRRPAPTTT